MRLMQSHCYAATGAEGGLGRVSGLCEEVEALCGMCARDGRLGEH